MSNLNSEEPAALYYKEQVMKNHPWTYKPWTSLSKSVRHKWKQELHYGVNNKRKIRRKEGRNY